MSSKLIEDALRKMRDPNADNERLLWADTFEAAMQEKDADLNELRRECKAEIERLRELVQSAYIEGHGDGNSDESLGFVGDWRDSTTRAALAGKENKL